MPRVHFLNVKNGDCSIIQHGSGRVSVLDVNCAVAEPIKLSCNYKAYSESVGREPAPGNFGRKHYPDNPIAYLNKIGVSSIFRFILTHPDMDHLDGIKDLFESFRVNCFWDTNNTKNCTPESFGRRADLRRHWQFYTKLRDGGDRRRRVYHSGESYNYFKGDGLKILAPTPALIADANRRGNWNDASYVLLYKECGKKILFCGDSEDKTWEHILKTWPKTIANVDVLIAPHHGRKSGRKYSFLNVVNPKLVVFGNADSEHLMYDACCSRGIPILTNNQTGYIVFDISQSGVDIWVGYDCFAKSFAKENQMHIWYNAEMDGWYNGTL